MVVALARRAVGSRRTRGQSVTELALILPVFLILTLGIIDMTRMYISYVSLENGVREAAVFASQGSSYNQWCATGGNIPCPAPSTNHTFPNPSNIAYRIEATATGMTPAQIVLSAPVCDNGTCNASSLTVKVTAKYTFRLLTPILSNVFGTGIPMTVSTTARILQ